MILKEEHERILFKIIAEYDLRILQLNERFDSANRDRISRAHERMSICSQLESLGFLLGPDSVIRKAN